MAEETATERSTSLKSRMTFKDDKEFLHKPIIRDILQTDICLSGSIMLVERVESIEASISNPSAVRLLLGDGELCIQAFLSPHMRRLVEADEITIGCYVRLDEFSLERTDIEGHENSAWQSNGEKPRKRKRRQQLVFLKVEEAETVGWDFAYMKYSKPALDTIPPTSPERNQHTLDFDENDTMAETNEIIYPSTEDAPNMSSSGSVLVEDLDLDLRTGIFGQSIRQDSAFQSLGAPKKTNDERIYHPVEKISEERYQVDPVDEPEEPATKRRLFHKPDEFPELPKPSKLSQELDISSRQLDQLPADSHHLEAPNKQIPTPSRNQHALIPRTLASLSKLPSRQNCPCTVFALIDEISPVKPCPIPPHKTREIRLVDPSTTKRVLLSVLWQPENFAPKVGTPVLLRGLKNHKYDGGSLNAYPKSVSPFTQNADGSDWWIPFPRGWDGCDVDGYLEWWEERRKGKMKSV